MIDLHNRRYIGNKKKLVDIIYSEVERRIKGNYTFADIFGGTGIVGYEFAKKGHKTIINDFLYSNYVVYQAFFGPGIIAENKMNKYLELFNNFTYEEINENYFNIYEGKYFSKNDAKKIGFIRDYIELNKNKFNKKEYYYLITSLMYATDKIANTVGHFEHYLKKEPKDSNFKLKKLKIKNNINADIYQEDANMLIKKISADVIYIDPPYNARQYVNFYHVLENLATWNKPTEFQGTSMKFKRDHLKSGYSQVKAKDLFEKLIVDAKAKIIIVSYNNTYNASSSASNNKIKQSDLREILENKGDVDVIEIEHKFFNSGKTNFINHKEFIYVCKIKEEK